MVVAGVVTHRQRPATAGGTTFLNLEDETGLVNVVCSQGCWSRYRRVARSAPAMVIRGRLERAEGVINVVAEKLEPLPIREPLRSGVQFPADFCSTRRDRGWRGLASGPVGRRVAATVVVLSLAVATGIGCVQRQEPVGGEAFVAPSTTGPAPTTVAPTVPVPTCAPLPDAATEAVPAAVQAMIDERLADPRFAGNDVSVSIWVDGWGEVAVRDPDHRLLPASNQKLFTAMGALDLLDPERRFVTSVVATSAPTEGVVDGDLVLVAGGDPTLRRTGDHSLAALARQVRAAGATRVRGSILVDESHFDVRRDADGWLDWQRPTYAGALSALVVDGNQHRGDAAFLSDPALGDTELLRRALVTAGVTVEGGVAHGTAPTAGVEIARAESATVATLVDSMLLHSDNMIAESLVKEIDVVTGGRGSTAAGLTAIRVALTERCIAIEGTDADGSGLSRANGRSAREWQRLLRSARVAPWAPTLLASLPLAGRSGTLSGG